MEQQVAELEAAELSQEVQPTETIITDISYEQAVELGFLDYNLLEQEEFHGEMCIVQNSLFYSLAAVKDALNLYN